MFDQSFLVVDSTMFARAASREASYRVGQNGNQLQSALKISLEGPSQEQALYTSNDGYNWKELPSITEDGVVKAYTKDIGYFKLGPKTIIVPTTTSIYSNYPNPFNPSTTIIYDIGFADGPDQRTKLVIYNLLGQHVRTVLDRRVAIGRHKIKWNGLDDRGVPVASGIYFVRLTTEARRSETRKVMLLR